MPGPYKKKAAFSNRRQQGFMFVNHPRIALEMAHNAQKHHKPVVAKRSKARKARRKRRR